PVTMENPAAYSANIENFIGTVKLPVGIIGPMRDEMIAFGTNDDIGTLMDWSNAMFGPRSADLMGVENGLYTPAHTSENEIYCDDVLADDLSFATQDEDEIDDMSQEDGQATGPMDGAPLIAPPAPPAPPPPAPRAQ
ncbi:MAG: hypothetical protein DI616_19425, partial [Paracoccus denitrificans]